MKVELPKLTRVHLMAIVVTLMVSLIVAGILAGPLAQSSGSGNSVAYVSIFGISLDIFHIAEVIHSTLFVGILSLLTSFGLVLGHIMSIRSGDDEVVGSWVHMSFQSDSMFVFASAFLLLGCSLIWANSQGISSLQQLPVSTIVAARYQS